MYTLERIKFLAMGLLVPSILVVILSCGSSTNNAPKEPSRVPISAAGDSTIFIRMEGMKYGNYYYFDKFRGTPINLVKGTTFRIKSREPIYLMEANMSQTPYILYPGDSIIIKDYENDLLLTSADNVRTNELLCLYQMVKKFGALRPLFSTTYLKQNTHLKQRDSIINKAYQDRTIFLDREAKEKKLSASYVALVKTLLEYSNIYEKYALYYKGFDRSSINAFYSDSIKVFLNKFSCDSCLTNTLYQTALLHFARSFLKEPNMKRPVLHLDNLDESNLWKMYNDIASMFKGNSKDYIRTTVAFQLGSLSKDNAKSSLKKFLSDINNEEYKQILNNAFSESNSRKTDSITGEDILITSNLATGVSLPKVLEKFKGKLVFLDFWATWCAPCIEEMPSSKELQNKNQSNLAVAFISLDEDDKKWASFSNDNLKDFNSFLMKHNFQSSFVKKYNINAIPRYILIGKDGKIISDDAPRPSDPKLQAILNKYKND